MSGHATGAVFLSYASQDAEAARSIADSLRAAGIEVWFDQSALKGGASWDTEIRHRIRDCALFVPIVSATTEQRTEGYFRLEWRLAEQRSHQMSRGRPFLVPVVIDDTPDDGAEVPDAFVDVQWTRLPGGEGAAAFAQHVNALLRPVEAKPVDAAAAALNHGHASGATASLRHPAMTGRRWMAWPAFVAVAAIVCVVGGGLWYFGRGGDDARAATGVGTGAGAGAGAGQPATPIADKSIAVLPFVNLSSNTDDEYLAEGLADTLLHMLAQVPDLKVIARTSSFKFKGQSDDVRNIGQQLGAATVLEGSLQRSGDRLRVIAQLINTRDGTHVWSKSFDRMMADVFAVQDEIAAQVTAALSVSLATPATSATKHTPTIEAYQEYLLGRQSLVHGDIDGVRAALLHFQKAIELDSGYALAYVGLADAHMESSAALLPRATMLARANAAIQQALRLDAESGEAYATLAGVRAGNGDTFGVEPAYRRAIELSPGYAVAWQRYGVFLIDEDRIAEARERIDRALALDPLSPDIHRSRGEIAFVEGQLEMALRSARRAIEIDSLNSLAYALPMVVHLARGQLDDAIRYRRRGLSLDPDRPGTWAPLGHLYLILGATDLAQQVLRELRSRWPDATQTLRLGTRYAEFQGQQAEAGRQAGSAVRMGGDVAAPELQDILARIGLDSGEAAGVLSALRTSYPELNPDSPRFSRSNGVLIPRLAQALTAGGAPEQARRLLAAAETWVRARPRWYFLTTARLGSTLVLPRILAQAGKQKEALAELRAAVDAGDGYDWQWWSKDSVFASIRNTPEFRQCVEIVKARNARQLESLRKQPDLSPT